MHRALSLVASGLVALSAFGAVADMSPTEVKFEDMAIRTPLTDQPGDAERGRAVLADRKKGNCLACHANSDMADQPFHGTIGPAMDGVGDRWEAPQLRAIVVNPKQIFGEQTIMPAFYRSTDELNRVGEEFAGKTILSAQEVEDVIAYLLTLKE